MSISEFILNNEVLIVLYCIFCIVSVKISQNNHTFFKKFQVIITNTNYSLFIILFKEKLVIT